MAEFIIHCLTYLKVYWHIRWNLCKINIIYTMSFDIITVINFTKFRYFLYYSCFFCKFSSFSFSCSASMALLFSLMELMASLKRLSESSEGIINASGAPPASINVLRAFPVLLCVTYRKFVSANPTSCLSAFASIFVEFF